MRKDRKYVTIRLKIKDEGDPAYWTKWTLPHPMDLDPSKRWAEKQIKEWNEIFEPDVPSRILRFG